MPQKLNYGSFEDLVTYLTFPDDWDDIAKVRAIYRWVTSVDVFSAQVNLYWGIFFLLSFLFVC